MANFFLIDQSLRDLGGHHHDYIRCVAEAASESGYLTTIGTHQQFQRKDTLQPFGQIKSVFRETTYHPDSYLSGLRHLTRNKGNYVSRNGWEHYQTGWARGLSFGRMAQALRCWRHHVRRRNYIRRFAVDCERFFQSVLFTENDHAFFTTVNEMEFMGLAAYLSNHPRTLQVHWHLQFHFNLFEGRTPEYHGQQHVANAIQNCFDAALSRIPYHRLNFYTTSEILADQFNRLGVGEFQVLAYPVRPELFVSSMESKSQPSWNSRSWQDRPLRITCPGEVRREKRMVKYLQPLVDRIWENHIQNRHVQIVVQRPVRKWPIREKIELHPPEEWRRAGLQPPPDWVQYYSHPLTDDEYLELIRNTDCGLLLYDSRAYYSRRAGVLSELLSCGKPVIVPAGSWLADQIAEPNFRYVDSLCNAQYRGRLLTLSDLKWRPDNVPLAGGVLSFDQSSHPFHLEFELEPQESGFVVEFDWHWPQDPGVYCRFEVSSPTWQGLDDFQVVGHRTNGMSPVAYLQSDQNKVSLSLTNAFHDSTASIQLIAIHTLRVDSQQTPRGAVGYIAAGEADIPRAIDEITAHYQHYLSTAQRYAQAWSQQHRPSQTISSLVAAETLSRRAA